MSEISNEMLNFRARHKLSQVKSAKLAGITVQTWNQVELGQQNPSRLTEAKIRMAMQTAETEVSE